MKALLTQLLVAAVSLSAGSGAIANHPASRDVFYDIELEYKGFLSLTTCTVLLNPNGYDRMAGTVHGDETRGPGVDVEYTGTLTRMTDIETCNLKGPTEDTKVDCASTLVGSARMDVSLLVRSYAGGGAWLKAKVIQTGLVRVSGNCDQDADDRAAYLGTATGGAGGASPDGQPIEDKFSRPDPNPAVQGPGPLFFLGKQARLRVGYYPPDPAAGGWALWVKRQVP